MIPLLGKYIFKSENLVSSKLGFKYQICEEEDGNGGYGYETLPGKWNGVIGLLNNSISALSISGLFILEKYSDAITYVTPPYQSYSIKMLMRTP